MSLELYRKMANTYLVENSEENAINGFVKQSDKIWDATLSTYDLLAPTKRGDDVVITDRVDLSINSRAVFNYNKEHTSVSMAIGQERCFLKKGEVEAGYYVQRTATDELFIIESLTDNKFLFEDTFVRKCNSDLNWIDKNTGVIHSYPCIKENLTRANIGTSENKYGIFVDRENNITVQFNEFTSAIKERDGLRFIFDDTSCYLLHNTNKTDKDGLVILSLQEDEINYETDKQVLIGSETLWIADYTDLPNYLLDVTTGNVELSSGTVQLEYSLTKDGIIADNSVVWSSDDELIATVDSNGLVTAVSDGIANITCTMADNSDVFDSVSVTVSAIVADNISYVVSPDVDSIMLTDSETFTISKFNNGVLVPETFTISVEGSSTALSSQYDFVVIDGNSFSLVNNDNGGNVVINIVPDSDVGSVFTKSYELKYFY